MNNELCSKILRVATNPMSATAIAQSVGKSKGYMIQDELQALVDSGNLEANDSGKYTTYRVVERHNTAVTNTNTESTVVEDVGLHREQVPAGYSVSKQVSRKSDHAKGHMITIPDGRKIFVKNGSSLVVINGEPVKTVQTPTSAMSVIAEYAAEHGMAQYTVTDTNVGTIGKVEDIKSYSGIIDVNVKKNNKAA